jgi:hypothetical protein
VPPSTAIVCPVTNELASDTSQATVPMTSAGVRLRRIACPSLIAASALSSFSPKNSRVPVGQHCARRYRVDADALAPEFASEAARQSDHGGLRCRVVQPVGHAVGRSQGCDIDDAAAAGAPHRRHDGFAAVPDPFHIDSHRGIPLRLGNGIEAAAVQGTVKSRVVDQRVNSAVFVESGLRHGFGGTGVGDVERDADRLPTRGPHELHCHGAIGDIRGNDTGACCAEAAGEFLPDAASGTGNYHNLVADFDHSIAVTGAALAKFR